MSNKPKSILFYQHFGHSQIFRGAHYKTLDYYKHIDSFGAYKPIIAFDEQSAWGPDIPWFHLFSKMPTLSTIKVDPDAYFLNSGKDWLRFQLASQIRPHRPIISPVNHFRALNPEHNAFKLLNQKATRLCPSPELYTAVKNHELTNGETIYLPNAIENLIHNIPDWQNRSTEVLIVGSKNPELAMKISGLLNSKYQNVKVIIDWISKQKFQSELANSKYSIHLPKAVEAHYLPGIEAMLLGSVVLMPNCVGNMSYAKHEETCYVTEYSANSIVDCIDKIYHLNHTEMIKRGVSIAKQYSVEKEKTGLLNVLNSQLLDC